MKIFKYDVETKEILEELEFKPQYGSNLPFTTDVNPLNRKDDFAVCFNEDKQEWEYIEDNRNKTVYSTITKEALIVDYLGTIKDGFTLSVPTEFDKWENNTWVKDIEVIKASKLIEINNACENAIISGFPSSALGSEYIYQSDRDDQLNLMGVVASNVDRKFKCGLVTITPNEDGTESKTITWDFLLHTALQLKQVLDDGADYKEQQIIKASQLKAQVQAATTVEELELIGW